MCRLPGCSANDLSPSGTPLTAAIVGQPANGTVTLNTDGSFSYTPNAGFVGTDTVYVSGLRRHAGE